MIRPDGRCRNAGGVLIPGLVERDGFGHFRIDTQTKPFCIRYCNRGMFGYGEIRQQFLRNINQSNQWDGAGIWVIRIVMMADYRNDIFGKTPR